MLQLVVVLLVIMKLIVNVTLVPMFVSLVTPLNVSNVKIHNTELYHNVSVLMDISIMVLNIVNNVNHNVLLVKVPLITVLLVTLLEIKLHQNVHVHQVKLILMDSAKTVTIDVMNVMKPLLIVNLVLISESMPHHVFAHQVTMMTVIMLNVSNV